MEFFPIFLKLRHQRCLLVGGGEVALRKARLLLAAGASLQVVAPELAPELADLAERGELEHLPGRYAPALLDGMRLAVAATDDAEVNRAVAADAEARGILVNVVDDAEASRYISPAIIDRSPLMVAVASGGSVPVLARSIRARLESLIPAGYGRLARFGSSFRDTVKARFPDIDARRRFWETVLEGPLADAVMNGDEAAARAEMEKRIAAGGADRAGAVYLVGAGPGNPDLLTFRALRLMQQADVVLYDKLVAPELLELVRRDAERVYVGKARANHALPQDDINQLLVDLARQGKRVLRLKGGDPFTFGRGGEEIATLAEHGIAFEVVPGITSASGAAAYAGIPLTHRDYAQSVTFVTGHKQDGSIDLDWQALTRPQQTVVVYMGVSTAAELCQAFVDNGRAASTPAAAVEWATTERQRTVCGTLAALPGLMASHGIASPALIIVGEVVELADKLSWYRRSENSAVTIQED
ncbi:uroporphyrinogen-III C-methyltransferase [Chromobacterium violaceum]|uniref:siroheme synthase CysG n=1 Tax=Chromobacterium violaceum TaxID=536 RepID=UPI0009D99B4A|nr:siroheme synthase CysG [Chromobacterium violaceum]OQS11205.1 uroporphyrinogen-III C-methyltransferase [Chromobacterium violaceum]OQS27630.1 uroporphyrinogen-III C-methyltransferase [Chromobacterium violaceum]